MQTNRFIPSEYQINIFNTFKNTNKNIAVSAVPGSGKTTTILELLKMIKPFRKAIYLAFNKSIVKEFETKVPKNISLSTLHSLGCSILYREYRGNVQVNEYKLYQIAKKIDRTFEIDKKRKEYYIFNLIKIIDLYRMCLKHDFPCIRDIIIEFNIETIGNEIKDAEKLLKAYYKYNRNWNNEPNAKFMVDYVDMIYLPNVNNFQFPKYDEILLDEAQDLNIAQQQLIEKIISPTGRIISVGDPNQAIYGFMGADINSYQYFKNRENTVELPLSISYRCSVEVIEEANMIYDTIDIGINQHKGIVDLKHDIFDIQNKDFVLCRNNKPLVELYLELIDLQKKVYIKGSDIGKKIISLIKPFKQLSKESMLNELNIIQNNTYNDLLQRGIRKPEKNQSYVTLVENIDIIKLIAKKYQYNVEIISAIETMFADLSNAIVLSSIHKSKGLETDNVYLLKPSLIPSQFSTTENDLTQEANLLYVAITRAKKNFYYLIY